MKKYTVGPETARLTHRAFEEHDAEALFALNSNPLVMQYTGETLWASVESTRSAIRDYPDFDSVGFGRWACVLKSTQEVIGFCGLKYLADLDAVDVGYRLLPEFWGRGIATEACKACVEFGFRTIGLVKIIGLVLPENLASIRVLEKSNLRFEKQFTYDGERVLQYAREGATANG